MIFLTEEQMKEAQKWSQRWLEFDMMREYDTSNIEAEIRGEIEAPKRPDLKMSRGYTDSRRVFFLRN